MLTGRLAADTDASSTAIRPPPQGLTVAPPPVACYFDDQATVGIWRSVADVT